MTASQEWLQTDNLGGFASGTVPFVRTRRYHALLLSASTPPTNRVVLVNGLELWAEPRSARNRFLVPLLAHLDEAGLGHVSGSADGDAPHTPSGCPFQAWSVGELLGVLEHVLGSTDIARPHAVAATCVLPTAFDA